MKKYDNKNLGNSDSSEKDNENYIEKSFKERLFWVMLFLIVLVLVGILIQNFHIMKYEKKIAFSNTSSSTGIEGWEKFDENAIGNFDFESPKEFEGSSEGTFKQYEATTTTTTESVRVSTNVAVVDAVIKEADDTVDQLIENSYGEKVAIYAREFYKEYQGKVKYGVDFELRKKAYWLIPEDDGTFTVDCVGLVNLIVHNATGFSLPDEGEYSGFVIPEGPKGSAQIAQVLEPFKFQDVIYDLHPGDILTVDGRGHEVIYIGNDEILDITNGLEIKSVREYKYDKRAQIVISEG